MKKRQAWSEYKYTVILLNGETRRYIGTHDQYCVPNGKFTIYNDNYICKKAADKGEDDLIIAEFAVKCIAGYEKSPHPIKKRKNNNGKT